MIVRPVATLALVLALAATAANATDLIVSSRYSELSFYGVGLGIGAPNRLIVEEDPLVTFDETCRGESWYVEPGGATNTVIFDVSQLSTIEPERITARMAQTATVGTDHGSPAVFQGTRFIIDFFVPFATPVRLDGAVDTPPWGSDTWSRVMLLQDSANLFNSQWSAFPYVLELEPYTTYTLQVDVNGGALFDATTLSSAEATLTVRADSDEDGLLDDADNCMLVANLDQRDTNGDGYGNACDPDLNDDGTVNFVDVGLLKAVFFTADADADLDGNGSVNFIDLGIAKEYFFQAPGPSGFVR